MITAKIEDNKDNKKSSQHEEIIQINKFDLSSFGNKIKKFQKGKITVEDLHKSNLLNFYYELKNQLEYLISDSRDYNLPGGYLHSVQERINFIDSRIEELKGFDNLEVEEVLEIKPELTSSEEKTEELIVKKTRRKKESV